MRGGSREIFLGWHEGGKEIKWCDKIKAFFFQTHMEVVTYCYNNSNAVSKCVFHINIVYYYFLQLT